MALGTVTNISPDAIAIEVLASAIAANGIPSAAAGIEANALRTLLGYTPQTIRVAVASTAGSGTMTVTCRLWHRLGALGWFVTKPLAAVTSAPQTAVAIAETGADTIGWSEEVGTVAGADRYYLEIVVIAGTSTAVTGWLVVAR